MLEKQKQDAAQNVILAVYKIKVVSCINDSFHMKVCICPIP